MTLNEFPGVLLKAVPDVYHQVAPDKPGKQYAVWNEIHARRQTGGPLLVRFIQVDFYTLGEFDPTLDVLLKALEQEDVFYEEPETSYDQQTRYTRYMIECQIIDSTRGRKEDNEQS